MKVKRNIKRVKLRHGERKEGKKRKKKGRAGNRSGGRMKKRE